MNGRSQRVDHGVTSKSVSRYGGAEPARWSAILERGGLEIARIDGLPDRVTADAAGEALIAAYRAGFERVLRARDKR